MELTVDDLGFKETLKSLDEIGPRFRDHVLRKAVREGSKLMQRAVKANIPGNLSALKSFVVIKRLKAKGLHTTELVGAKYAATRKDDHSGALLQIFEFGTGAKRETEAAIKAFGSTKARGEAYEIEIVGGDDVIKFTRGWAKHPSIKDTFAKSARIEGIEPVAMFRRAVSSHLRAAEKKMAQVVKELGKKELEALGAENINASRAKRAGF